MPLTWEESQAQPVQVWIGEGGFQFIGIQISRPLEPLRVEMVILIDTAAGTQILRTGDIRPLSREHWRGTPIADPQQQRKEGPVTTH
jgi:hypothetical protein